MGKPFISRGINDEHPNRHADDGESFTYLATAVRETEAALLCRFIDNADHTDEEHWIPKSCIHDDSEVYARGHYGKLVVKAWFARKELDGLTHLSAPRKLPRPLLPVEMSTEVTGWLDTLYARNEVTARPCKALVELEQRGYVVRSGGPGAETMWKVK